MLNICLLYWTAIWLSLDEFRNKFIQVRNSIENFKFKFEFLDPKVDKYQFGRIESNVNPKQFKNVTIWPNLTIFGSEIDQKMSNLVEKWTFYSIVI